MRKLRFLILAAVAVSSMGTSRCDFSDHTLGHHSPRRDEPVAPVPEPTSALLFGAGLMLVAAGLRKRS